MPDTQMILLIIGTVVAVVVPAAAAVSSYAVTRHITSQHTARIEAIDTHVMAIAKDGKADLHDHTTHTDTRFSEAFASISTRVEREDCKEFRDSIHDSIKAVRSDLADVKTSLTGMQTNVGELTTQVALLVSTVKGNGTQHQPRRK